MLTTQIFLMDHISALMNYVMSHNYKNAFSSFHSMIGYIYYWNPAFVSSFRKVLSYFRFILSIDDLRGSMSQYMCQACHKLLPVN